jgi:hypothetical protein
MAEVYSDNAACIRLHKKLGAVCEGRNPFFHLVTRFS